MKKILSIILILTSIICLCCGCTNNNEEIYNDSTDTESTLAEEKIIDGNIIEYCPKANEYIKEDYYSQYENLIKEKRAAYLNSGTRYSVPQPNGIDKIQYDFDITLTLHPEKDIIIGQKVRGDHKKSLESIAYEIKGFLDAFPFTISYKTLLNQIEQNKTKVEKNDEIYYEYSYTESGVKYNYYENKTTEEIYIDVAIDRSFNLEPHHLEQTTDYSNVLQLQNYKLKSYYTKYNIITLVAVCDKCSTECEECTFRPEYYAKNKTVGGKMYCKECSKYSFKGYYFNAYFKIK